MWSITELLNVTFEVLLGVLSIVRGLVAGRVVTGAHPASADAHGRCGLVAHCAGRRSGGLGPGQAS